ncbi:hypothetical protein [Mycolicibacterium nivoides]|uniref:hypothetical protein n=1 Tax=Mycolicibacterium nivoides TaxID=2487344 RepID=UPI000F5C02C6|nr:hypothetical protein [Mycolicibacterium nivoides]
MTINSTTAAISVQRPTIRMRHMSMTCGGGFADRPTETTFSDVDGANNVLIALSKENDHAMGGVILEPDLFSPVTGAFHVVIYWGATSDRYHLDTID